ncbi:MAG: alpha/beta hydrolase domain-containing protein [Bryobacteraceae bacterium]|nr:alpha/beta hydrolase domain-containing protein [Bryobacteraceae bacterium]
MRCPIVAVLVCCAASAAVVRLDIIDRSPVLDGRAFGKAGAYERLKGKALLAVDPKLAANQRIVDLKLAPRNAEGLVEFSTDIFILRPVDVSKGNGTVLFEVPNRGGKGMLAMFNRAQGSADPGKAEHFGDALLLNEGYTLVWIGWQTDVPAGADRMRLYAPVAAGVKGLVRAEHTPDRAVDLIPLGDASHTPYAVDSSAPVKVTVRDGVDGERKVLAASEWTLEKDAIRLHAPATPGRIYEVIYASSDPPVVGLGAAAIRDVIAHLKREHKYAIGFGTSQSAMLLRGYLYEGFNKGEDGRQVFDGIFAHVAGARRATFHRFVQHSRTAGPLRNGSLSPTEQFPFADLDQKDHVTGRVDGILQRARAAKVMPKVFYTNSAYEYWGSGASLVHTTTDGKRDLPLAPTTRMYLFAGGQHGPAAFPPSRGRGQNLANFNDYRWAMRALLGHLQAWVSEGKTPPPASYPRITDGTLTALQGYRFPALPEVALPVKTHQPAVLDFGKDYLRAGVVTTEPPRVVNQYAPLVPQAGKDGNDVAGVRMPEVSCSLGVFTGWNLRNASAGASDTLLANTGSYIPLATVAGDYSGCASREARALADHGLLLPEDVTAVADLAVRHREWALSQSTRSAVR